MVRWEIGTRTATGWKFEGAKYDDPGIAVAELVMRTGVMLHAQEQPNGTFEVRNEEGDQIACVRQHTDVAPGEGERFGPLRRWHGLSWVGWLNFLLLRWFLVRIVYTVEEDNSISRYNLRWWPSWRW